MEIKRAIILSAIIFFSIMTKAEARVVLKTDSVQPNSYEKPEIPVISAKKKVKPFIPNRKTGIPFTSRAKSFISGKKKAIQFISDKKKAIPIIYTLRGIDTLTKLKGDVIRLKLNSPGVVSDQNNFEMLHNRRWVRRMPPLLIYNDENGSNWNSEMFESRDAIKRYWRPAAWEKIDHCQDWLWR